MTLVNQNSISGINSITAESSTLTFHDNGGVERVRVSSGKVGIGTDNPKIGSGGIHIYTGASGQTGSNSAGLVIEDSNDAEMALLCPSTNVGRIKFGDENTANRAQVRYDHTDDSMQFTLSGNDEKLRITSSGNIGIGTDNPARELVVHNDNADAHISIRSVESQQAMILFGDNASDSIGQIRYDNTDNSLAFRVNIDERLRIDSSGNIGINSTSPKTDLDISQKTGAIALPQGTTTQRPTGSAPYIRWNTTNSALEVYNGTNWVELITDYFPTGSMITSD